MSEEKQIRRRFREAVFHRDGYRCRCCGRARFDRQGGDAWRKFHPQTAAAKFVEFDSHHIINRTLIEEQGCVAENGIAVCTECHRKCEEYWTTGGVEPGFAPDDMFARIGSSEEFARAGARKRL